MSREKREWVQIKVLLEPHDHRRIDDAAHAARLPTAVFAREILLGRVPKIAPPLVSQLCPEARELLQICHSGTSNLRQLATHSTRLGDPLSRLTNQDGPLDKLREKLRQLDLQIKSGDLQADQANVMLTKIYAPSQAMNDLARSLNEGDQPGRQIWFDVLTNLQAALNQPYGEVAK